MSGDEQADGKAQGQPDDSEPSPERQAELEAAYEANVEAGNQPYWGVQIRTRGEICWLMEKRLWSTEVYLRAGYGRVNLCGADLTATNLTGIDLNEADLSGADLNDTNLATAHLIMANLSDASLMSAQLCGGDLTQANLSSADLSAANLSRADLSEANLSDANLSYANLSGACLGQADLSNTNLRASRMDVTTSLTEIVVTTSTQLADVIWDDVPITRIAWEDLPRVGDEAVASQRKDEFGKCKDGATRLDEYKAAARSYRQLAVALRIQGLSEDADRYAYRAQLMQRIVLRRQAFLRRKDRRGGLRYRIRKFTAYIGSGLLDLIAGYGYRPGRSLLAYILIILTFAGLYLLNGQFAAPHLRWDEALVLSVSSFHGRGFFTTDIHLGDTLARLAAGEAIIGLLIEITFIATFTQRFFSR